MANQNGGPNINEFDQQISKISEFLLDNKFLLTSLELFQECQEKQKTIPFKLLSYFTNNEWIQTLPSLKNDPIITSNPHYYYPNEEEKHGKGLLNTVTSVTHGIAGGIANLVTGKNDREELLEIIKEKDKKIAILEYDIRYEKKNQQILREDLQAAYLKNIWNEMPEEFKEKNSVFTTDFEKAVVNHIIEKHLVDNMYKHTALSFNQEKSGSKLPWKDIKKLFDIEDYKPPSLVHLYRYFIGGGVNKHEFGFREKLTELKDENKLLKEKLISLQNKADTAETKVLNLEKENSSMKETLDKIYLRIPKNILDFQIKQSPNKKQNETEPKTSPKTDPKQNQTTSKPENNTVETDTNVDEVHPKENQIEVKNEEKPVEEEKKRKRNFGPLFLTLSHSKDEGTFNERVGKLVLSLHTLDKTTENIIKIISTSLPHIKAGLIIKQREELLPVLLCALCWNNNSQDRINLTQILFNLIPIPNEHQRNVIMEGCVWLAALSGEERTANELLPHCWEQINNEYPERRLLVSESCGKLAKFVKDELRLSLLLSILQQLVEDPQPLVRESVVRNLAMLVSASNKITKDKYEKVKELLTIFLKDSDENVRNTTIKILYPIFCDICEKADQFEQYLEDLFSKIEILYNKQDDKTELYEVINMISSTVCQLYELVLQKQPLFSESELEKYQGSYDEKYTGQNIYIFNSKELQYLKSKFNQIMESSQNEIFSNSEFYKKQWYPIYWVITKFIPNILKISSRLDPTKKEDEKFIYNLCKMSSDIGNNFGTPFVKNVIKPIYEQYLNDMKTKDTPEDYLNKRKNILSFYICGIIPFLDESDRKISLSTLIISIAENNQDWKFEQYQILSYFFNISSKLNEKMKNYVIDVLWELISNQSKMVRESTIQYFSLLSKEVLMQNEIANKVLPAIITLSGDQEKNVRIATIKCFGDMAMNTSDELTLEKLMIQFETMIRDGSRKKKEEIVDTLATIVPHVTKDFREKFIIKQVYDLNKTNSTLKSENKKRRMVLHLFGCYKNLRQCNDISLESQMQILDGLKLILPDARLLSVDDQYVLHAMIKEFNAKTNSGPPTENVNNNSDIMSDIGKKTLKFFKDNI